MDEIKQEEPEMETEAKIKLRESQISFKNKMMLLAIFGILLGFVIKTEAAKRVTVGFEDYKLLSAEKMYDINDLQKELERQKNIQEEKTVEAEKKALEAEDKAVEAAKEAKKAEIEKNTCDVGAGETCQ